MKIVRTLLLILGIFIILFCIFGYIDYNGQKMELGAKQEKIFLLPLTLTEEPLRYLLSVKNTIKRSLAFLLFKTIRRIP
ncbi:hypothetical protein LAV77_19470 [Priestia megaterium]|uniref:hypothetical protein n=1 Tax=Priestia megaterium TaxID=1404 RepID=UPI002B24128B|nr:hypothetical protein [Priestia megaterium]MEB2266982.1 hypothetical protein [Priestia megaterium]